MSPKVAELVEASRSLSDEDRLELANAIWELIPPDMEWMPSPEALAEVNRRLADHERDPGSAISWDEMKERLAQLRNRSA